jgi:C4-dicarboxylate-specific signal transduction histidine kinase
MNCETKRTTGSGAKLATLGELTTGVAHELNNPLNNIGLFIGNVIDIVQLGGDDTERMLRDLNRALDEVHRASQIITHLRTFGRVAPASTELVPVNSIIVQALSLMHEQLRLRNIEVELGLCTRFRVLGNAIQLRASISNSCSPTRVTRSTTRPSNNPHHDQVLGCTIRIMFKDSGPGVYWVRTARVRPILHDKGSRRGARLGLSITQYRAPPRWLDHVGELHELARGRVCHRPAHQVRRRDRVA